MKLLIDEIKNIAPNRFIEFMDYVDERLPKDYSETFFDKIFNDFPTLPIEIAGGFYIGFLKENHIDNIDIYNKNQIISAFQTLEQR